MNIGLAFTLKSEAALSGKPDDWQEEFDSPATVAAIESALEQLGHKVTLLGDGPALVRKLLADPPDMVFNIAEGHGVGRSREARVPAVCEMLGIPYTGSDPLTCAATLDKYVARRLVESLGVTIPFGTIACPNDPKPDPRASFLNCDKAEFTSIVKPAWEGSSKGIRGKCLVHNQTELDEAVERLIKEYNQPILIEKFIDGDELTVGVIGNDPPTVLGIMRVVPLEPTGEFVYSLEVKRDWQNQVRYEIPPAGYDQSLISKIEWAALDAYRALGCRDVARIDFRLRDGVPYFLEINPLPGLNPETGDIVLIAKAMGVSHTELIGKILSAAMDRSAARRS